MTSSLPESHPQLDSTNSSGTACPVSGNGHGFTPVREGDSRSPCPALNALANHGYLPRDGKNLAPWDIASALQMGYGLSTPLATFLSYGTFIAISPFSRISLAELSKHNVIEHDASILHDDTPVGQDMASIDINSALVKALINDIKPTAEEVEAKKALGEEAGFLMGIEDAARARIRREKECRPLSRIRQRVARGELSLFLGVFSTTVGDKTGVPVELLRTWFQDEKLPENWKPDHVEGFLDMFKRGNKMLGYVTKFRAEEEEAKKVD